MVYRFQAASEELARHTETLQQWQRQKQETEARQDDLQMRLRGAGSTQHSKELIAQIEQCEAETDRLNQSIQAALLALPLALLPESDIVALKTQITAAYCTSRAKSRTRTGWKNSGRRFPPIPTRWNY